MMRGVVETLALMSSRCRVNYVAASADPAPEHTRTPAIFVAESPKLCLHGSNATQRAALYDILCKCPVKPRVFAQSA